MRSILDNVLSRALIILMSIMVINVLWQVASRYLFNSPSGFTDELAGFLLIWVGLLGAAYATGKGMHLAIDILHDKLVGRKKVVIDATVNLAIILFAVAVLVIGGSRLVFLTLLLEQTSANLEIPLGYVYLVLPLSGLLIAYYGLDNLIRTRIPNYGDK